MRLESIILLGGSIAALATAQPDTTTLTPPPTPSPTPTDPTSPPPTTITPLQPFDCCCCAGWARSTSALSAEAPSVVCPAEARVRCQGLASVDGLCDDIYCPMMMDE